MPFFQGDLGQRLERTDHPGVVDRDVEPSELAYCLGHHFLMSLSLADVASRDMRSTAIGTNFIGDLAKLLLTPGRQHNGGALSCEHQRDCTSDAGGCAGNDSNLAVKHGHMSNLLCFHSPQRHI